MQQKRERYYTLYNNNHRIESESEELEDTALDMKDYSDKYELNNGVKQSWDALSDSISECLYPAEHRTEKFNEIQAELKALAEKGGLAADFLTEHLAGLMERFTETGFLAEEVAEQIYAPLEVPASDSRTFLPLSITEIIGQLTTRLTPAFGSLRSAWQDIFTDGKLTLDSADILSACSSIKSSLDTLDEMVGITIDYSAFEDFIKVLNNTEAKEKDIETAFDSLATSITQAALLS